MSAFPLQVGRVVLVPSSGGVFEVTAGDKVIYSKRATGRFPKAGEVVKLLNESGLLGAGGP